MVRTTGVDAFFSNEIFRKDNKVIIAAKRELAVILPVRLAPKGSDYVAGEVLGQYTSGPYDGFFGEYDDSGASGLDTATCILLHDVVDQDSSSAASTPLAQALYKGIVYKDNLTGWTSSAATDLKAREFVSSLSETLIEF